MTEKLPCTAMCGSMMPWNCSGLLLPLSPDTTSALQPTTYTLTHQHIGKRENRGLFVNDAPAVAECGEAPEGSEGADGEEDGGARAGGLEGPVVPVQDALEVDLVAVLALVVVRRDPDSAKTGRRADKSAAW